MSQEKIYIAGHRGMVGSAITGLCKKRGYTNIVTRTREELDLRQQDEPRDFVLATGEMHSVRELCE